MAEQLALLSLDHYVSVSNPTGGGIHLMTAWHLLHGTFHYYLSIVYIDNVERDVKHQIIIRYSYLDVPLCVGIMPMSHVKTFTKLGKCTDWARSLD